MKKIILKRMSLLNFKGIRQLDIDFGDAVTNIHGKNGTGKTTIFDAFTWVMFGKDSRDRKQFDIKTLDASGVAIPRLPHEVIITLDVDGEPVTLTRRYCEKWVKRRGSAFEEFTGHEEERLYNDVPCSVKEWAEKIAAICPEEVFKFITSPAYFVSQKVDAQRAMLFRMVGGFSDNEVAEANGRRTDFIDLLGVLCGKTIEEYKREIAAKKRRLKAEIASIPERIDERRRDNESYTSTDYAKCEAEIWEKEAELAGIRARQSKASARVDASFAAKKAIADSLIDIKNRMLKLESEVRGWMSEDYYMLEKQRAELSAEIGKREALISSYKHRLPQIDADIQRMSAEREKLLAEHTEINRATLTFGENDFICPTCGQHLDLDGVEKKRAEMVRNFNAQKAAKLEANKERGQRCSRTKISELQTAKDALLSEIAKAEQEIAHLRGELTTLATPARPSDDDVKAQLATVPDYQQLKAEEARLLAELDKPAEAADDESPRLTAEADRLTNEIAELKTTLKGAAYMQRNNERIAELEEQLITQNEALARLEGIEFTMAEFSKARTEAVESKINTLFTTVRFKMYEQQINGGEIETCEATVDGVPYSSLNNAGQINAGLDIINAICKNEGIAAPIMIDNAESVNELTATESQQIRLFVTDDTTLKIY